MPATEIQMDRPPRTKPGYPSSFLLFCAGTTILTADLFGEPGFGGSITVGLIGIAIAILLSIAAIFQSSKEDAAPTPTQPASRRMWLFFAALLLIHAVLALVALRWMPAASVDTYTFQHDSCQNLFRGIDPYGATQIDHYDAYHSALFYGQGMVVNGRVQVGFQYPPITLVWALPGYLLGDLRISYVFAVMLSAFFVFALCPNPRGLMIAGLLLLNPGTLLVEALSWTEPMILLALAATVFAAIKKRWWLPIALGLFLATKQYNFLALPFIGFLVVPFNWRKYWTLVASSLGIAVATVLPFACWNVKALWHDLVLFHLAQPFRHDALSLAVPFPLMLKIGPVILVVFIAWALRSLMRNPAMFATGFAVSLLLFVSTNKQAFSNYYFLIAQALLLTSAALPGALNPNPATGRESISAESPAQPAQSLVDIHRGQTS